MEWTSKVRTGYPETMADQIDRLAKFIMEKIPGEPSRSEGAIDTAIRIMREELAGMSASEALYGFCGWLTTRSRGTFFGADAECAGIPDLVQKFCIANGLVEPRDGWHTTLVHPKE